MFTLSDNFLQNKKGKATFLAYHPATQRVTRKSWIETSDKLLLCHMIVVSFASIIYGTPSNILCKAIPWNSVVRAKSNVALSRLLFLAPALTIYTSLRPICKEKQGQKAEVKGRKGWGQCACVCMLMCVLHATGFTTAQGASGEVLCSVSAPLTFAAGFCFPGLLPWPHSPLPAQGRAA